MLPGAELAGRDYLVRRLAGATLDRGGTRTVDVKVVNLLPFIVLKALALHNRDKDKDAYDIVWTLNAFENGPASAADAAGCALYARFEVGEEADDDRRLVLQRYANATVRNFLTTWEAGLSGFR
jgi:hypothetical protein